VRLLFGLSFYFADEGEIGIDLIYLIGGLVVDLGFYFEIAGISLERFSW
jgi:hypothetical protein